MPSPIGTGSGPELCPLCGAEAPVSPVGGRDAFFVECPACAIGYVIEERLAHLLWAARASGDKGMLTRMRRVAAALRQSREERVDLTEVTFDLLADEQGRRERLEHGRRDGPTE